MVNQPKGGRGAFSPSGGPSRAVLLGVLVRCQCWRLTRKGWLLSLVLLLSGAFGVGRSAHSFLASSGGGSAEVMVVEGWISARHLGPVAAAFARGHCRTILVVRDITDEDDPYISGRYTAERIVQELARLGIPASRMEVLFCGLAVRDRTYHCATVAKQWLAEHGKGVASIDVVTMAVHARRSRLLYSKAFGDGTRVESIAIADSSYDASHWWRSSAGVREVVSELVAYGYARFFFWPGAATGDPGASSILRAGDAPGRGGAK